MKIAAANLQMASSHVATQHREIKESLRMWVGAERPDAAGNGRPRASAGGTEADISPAGKAAQCAEAQAIEESKDATNKDPKLALIRSLIEMLTGRQVEVFDAAVLADGEAGASPVSTPPQAPGETPVADQPAGWGLEYDRHESYSESEQTTFSASGTVRTADGREINFDLSLSMARSYHMESDVSLRLGDAARRKDPLVVNFAGTAASLTDTRFAFDIDSDGKSDQINFVAAGSGFLMLDRNGDGKASNGSELFGAASGNGFAELARLDDDGNGWIDENDVAYDKLQVWSRDGDGSDRYRSLQEAGVGAISLSHASTPFDLKTAANETLGQIRSSGIFLRESGEAGTIQQIDLTA